MDGLMAGVPVVESPPFGQDHYVPILRAKRAERNALDRLEPGLRARLSPVLELPPTAFVAGAKRKPGPKSPIDILVDFLAYSSSAAKASRVFTDFGLLRGTPYQLPLWADLVKLTGSFKGQTTPVIHLQDPPIVISAVAKIVRSLGRGCALRVGTQDVVRPTFSAEVVQLLRTLGLTPSDVDLIVDLATDPAAVSHGQLRASIPSLSAWRTWTVAAGVFPKDLTQFSPRQQRWRVRRLEWLHYLAEVTAAPSGARIPTFGDFTIQHGIYIEAPSLPPSVSLRYTLPHEWLILRGEQSNAKKNSGHQQMYGHAAVLRMMPEYCGSGFSWGDAWIAQCAPPQGPGNAETWLTVGVNHHMSMVATQVGQPTASGAGQGASTRGPLQGASSTSP